jgi:hypothetical protein
MGILHNCYDLSNSGSLTPFEKGGKEGDLKNRPEIPLNPPFPKGDFNTLGTRVFT